MLDPGLVLDINDSAKPAHFPGDSRKRNSAREVPTPRLIRSSADTILELISGADSFCPQDDFTEPKIIVRMNHSAPLPVLKLFHGQAGVPKHLLVAELDLNLPAINTGHPYHLRQGISEQMVSLLTLL